MPAKTILLVDDEPSLIKGLRHILELDGYRVVTARDGHSALELARATHPDLIVLDLMLPGQDGMSVCREIRTFSQAPVIILSARHEELDKVLGLEVGADDYVTKPFSSRELLARIHAQLRRLETISGIRETNILTAGNLVMDAESCTVTLEGQPVELTSREFALLRVLMGRPGRVFTREELLERVWGYQDTTDTRVVDTSIRRLRSKLGDDPSEPRFIHTRRGMGYVLLQPGGGIR